MHFGHLGFCYFYCWQQSITINPSLLYIEIPTYPNSKYKTPPSQQQRPIPIPTPTPNQPPPASTHSRTHPRPHLISLHPSFIQERLQQLIINRMKQRKSNDKQGVLISLPPKRGGGSSGSASTTKRRGDTSNKENNIQMTQSLETLTLPSKQFIHSRESFTRNSRPNLHEITPNARNLVQHPLTTKKVQRQQEIFDRRLSLKYTKNLSQQLESHLSHRLSMAPERESFGSSNRLPQSLLDERCSMGSSTVVGKEGRGKEGIKKEAIITNFMNKLDQEEDLRSIIESKLKGSASKDRRNHSFLTEFAEDNSSKIRQCQSQIKSFKNIIKEMSEKILEMTAEERGFKKKQNSSSSSPEPTLTALIAQLTHLCTCQSKQLHSVATQTQPLPQPVAATEAGDFFANLQKTLKVLDTSNH